MSIVSSNVFADTVCEDLSDKDQLFINDLCEQNNISENDSDICSENFIVKAKRATEGKAFIYNSSMKSPEADLYASSYYGYPISVKVDCTKEGLSITGLAISGISVRHIPESIAELEHIRELIFYDIDLVELPPAIAKLNKLEKLSLRNNHIPIIPSFLADMPNLKYVDFYINDIYSVDLDNLTKLLQHVDYINLGNNDLSGKTRAEIRDLVSELDKVTDRKIKAVITK